MSKTVHKQVTRTASGSDAAEKKLGDLFPPETIQNASYLGDGFILLKLDTGETVTSKIKTAVEGTGIRKIPGLPLITKREVRALAARLGYGLPTSPSGEKTARRK